jgi:hypothetical protein
MPCRRNPAAKAAWHAAFMHKSGYMTFEYIDDLQHSFAHVGAAVEMRVEDFYPQGKRLMLFCC